MLNTALISDAQVDLLDWKVRRSLASSIESIFDTHSRYFDTTRVELSNVINNILSHRILPGVFGRYFQIVPALTNGQFNLASQLMKELVDYAAITPKLVYEPYSDKLMSDFEHYARLVALGSQDRNLLAEPSLSQWQNFAVNYEGAMELLNNAEYTFRKEIDALVVRVIGAIPSETAQRQFGGISSLMLWGAIFLNINQYKSVLDIAEALVHESGHHLLFALSIDEPLVENSLHDSFSSPLRNDLRPMDGVFHATFVCARIYHFYECHLQHKTVAHFDRTTVNSRLAEYHHRFKLGYKTLIDFGNLTPNGKHILSAVNSLYL